MLINTEHNIGDTVYGVWRHYSTDKWGVVGQVEVSNIEIVTDEADTIISYSFFDCSAIVDESLVFDEKYKAKLTAEAKNKTEQ